jgi:tRNA dimethylallyltransferase
MHNAELQSWRVHLAFKIYSAHATAARSPSRSGRSADHRVADSCHHTRPLLAQHCVERPLSESANPLLVVILGPTASGKTALSLEIADKFSGEIVNCDSVAMYREFEIGTAKPNAEERSRAPHHLFDCVDATGSMTAGEYSRRTREVLREIASRNRLPIVVGGTGLYLRALLDGLFAAPQRSEELRERLREQTAARGSTYLHRVLQKLDHQAAEKIHANDVPKLIRAIEVSLASRKPMTEMWKEGREPLTGFRIVRIGLNPDRALLYDRINRRAQKMFDDGLVEETQHLCEKYGEHATPLQSLGYKQAMQLLRGESDLPSAIQAAQQAHRNYAKRQMTWFRREPETQWLSGFGDDPEIQNKALAMIGQSI